MKEYIIQVDDNPIWDGSRKVFETKELVRCKDCKHYNSMDCANGFGWCELYDYGRTDDFFCADGERKE